MRMRRGFLLAVALLGARLDAGEMARPAAASGTLVVPDRFLRRFDPVTVFFESDRGPAQGGPEDQPKAHAAVKPPHPGAWTWLDARTLQFRPVDPWPPLARFTIAAGGRETTLSTLLAPPQVTSPERGAEGLEPFDEIALTFPEPLDAAALARMTTVELRALPGIGAGEARTLGAGDLAVKALERARPGDPARYVLALASPVPLGTRATLKLRLALDERSTDAVHEVSFSTGEPFHVTRLGCRRLQYPVAAEGSRYAREQAIECDADRTAALIVFSGQPADIGPIEGRNLVEIEPPVGELSWSLSGKSLEVAGKFERDTLYRLRLRPAPLRDRLGRPLQLRGDTEVWLHFPRKASFLRLGAGQGIVERLGAQVVPVEGRGDEEVDLRVVPVDPLDRSFWPFPSRPVMVDESQRPPGPGEEPAPHRDPTRNIEEPGLGQQLRSLKTVPYSRIVKLPLRQEGAAASFGLDLEPALGFLAGRGEPGTYLVGIRRLDGGAQRSWMRVQATDLALSIVEEPAQVRFVVTSLATGGAVAGAEVRIEGSRRLEGRPATWETFGRGTTDAAGSLVWKAPGLEPKTSRQILRIVVQQGRDTLVLDPAAPPEVFADNAWLQGQEPWLGWTLQELKDREPPAEWLGHVFTERPVYRPEDKVHIRGWVRRREKGKLSIPALEGMLVIQGPGDLVWRHPTTLSPTGGFYRLFQEKDLPTGEYSARFERKDGTLVRAAAFRMEAYRIPQFEVRLHAPKAAPLDREFEVKLTASYYAGGKAAGRPVAWRVTQFPEVWTPKRRAGFEYSSDARFSRGGRFESSPRLETESTTSPDGAASISLNPAIEPTAQPRSYVIEATVTGADDQTVTATHRVLALPPFTLGLKLPRLIEDGKTIDGEWLAAGPEGELLAGQAVLARLIKREWHSHLRASDFTEGIGRYVTDVVDTRIEERKLSSTAAPQALSFAVPGAGVYLVELESHDRLGRAQVVTVDLFVKGPEPVAWSKPATRVFSVATDKDAYNPGETAKLLLESPYQQARALAVIEAPEGNRYEWIEVKGGAATFALPVAGSWAPRLPVHFLLERGRVAGTKPQARDLSDLGRPAALAATLWVKVHPEAHRLGVGLSAPEKARPGDTIQIGLTLADPKGAPLSGEVALWLVDQAVLALGREARLDPVPDFLTDPRSRLRLYDTRNLAFGWLPFAEAPGGDGAAEGAGDLLDRATVRKRFESVPYYNPSIPVGPDGKAVVTLQLPDDLTNFKIRAKAVSGAQRFGFADGQIAVRLPLVVQPALPRFVRPGDRFVAAATGRVVEGEGGAGAAEMRAENLTILAPARRTLEWTLDRAERLEWLAEVPDPPYTPEGELRYREVKVRVGVERAADTALDAFELTLPLREDRSQVVKRSLLTLVAGKPTGLPNLDEPARPGTTRREVLVSSEPVIVAMAAGLDFLRQYPFGCTEQRLSRARGELALKGFRKVLGQAGGDAAMDRAVNDTLEWVPQVMTPEGLAAFWPGSPGYVSLTAWVLEFLVEAREAGFRVDPKLLGTLTDSLERALRSDYGRFIDGNSWAERAWALQALARAGKFNPAYAAELARATRWLDAESAAEVLIAFSHSPQAASDVLPPLIKKMTDSVFTRLHEGREVYGGIQREFVPSGLILPSETRAIAEIARALRRSDAAHPKLRLLVDALATLGRDDGWGSTNASAAALRALTEVIKPGLDSGPERIVNVRFGEEGKTLAVGGAQPVARTVSLSEGKGQAILPAESPKGPVVIRAETRYVPAAPGAEVAPAAQGFVVTREVLRVLPGAPAERIDLAKGGVKVGLAVGGVIEEHIQVVNPKQRHYVAIVIPLAAGVEPMNPALATAPPEAQPTGSLTLTPTYVAMLDDRVEYYYNDLPAGTYDFHFRARASVAGSFSQPPAWAEMMYDAAVRGHSAGARVEIERAGD